MRTWKAIIVMATLLVCVAPLAAQAQSVVNPTQALFESTDHNLAVAYDLGYYLSGAASPVQTVRVPVASVAGGPTYSILLSKPLLGQNLTLKARLIATAAGGGEITSDWSDPSNPFSFLPARPSVPVVK